jgi:hypothetical protein
VVRPSSARGESLCILAATLVLAISTTVLARVNAQDEESQPLRDWQLSAFRDLGPTDQAVFNALTIAADTVWVWYEDTKTWTPIEDMQDPTTGVAPFAHDLSWKQMGEIEWRLDRSFSFEGSTAYFGSNGKIPGQGSYLLLLGHAHKGVSYANQSTIWIHRNPRVASPATINRDSLIRNGWREIVSYTGGDEVERLRGNQ